MEDLRGIRGETLESVELVEGAAIVGCMEDAPAPSRESLEAQDNRIRALHRRAIERAAEDLRARLTQQRADLTRWNADSDEVRRSVMKLVLTLVDFLRQLMERQALRRMEASSLSEEIENFGRALMQLKETIHDLANQAGLEPQDLNIDLGPFGKLK